MNTRLDPPDRASLDDDVAELIELIGGDDAAATMVMLARDPVLLGPFLTWAAALARNGVLPRRDHEILALRASHNCASRFEWVEHSEFARAAGLDDVDIAAIAEGADSNHWGRVDRALLTAADELHSTSALSDETYAALAGHYDAAALVEIPMVVGQYTMLSMLTGAFGIPEPPPG